MAKKGTPHETKKRIFPKPVLIGIGGVVVALVALLLFELIFLQRIYPGVAINKTSVSGLTQDQATQRLQNTLKTKMQQMITYSYNGEQVQLPLDATMLTPDSYDFEEETTKAFAYGRTSLYFKPVNIPADIQVTPALQDKLSELTTTINQPAIDANLKIEDDQIQVTASQTGKEVDQSAVINQLLSHLTMNSLIPSELPIKITQPNLSYENAIEIKKVLDKIKLNPLTLVYEDHKYVLDLNRLLSLLDLNKTTSSLAVVSSGQRAVQIDSVKVGDTVTMDPALALDETRLNDFISEIAKDINRNVEEPLLQFDGQKVVEFKAPRNGLTVNAAQTKAKIAQALQSETQVPIAIPVDEVTPKNSLSNDLGIKERVGRGESNFNGSITNRIFNVNHASNLINGIVVAPGDEFSFVNTVGDISAATGFKPAYVIKSGRTVLDDGGGVCQVSTTLFRAVLNAGLPITARTAHAYRVGYYEQGYPPGIDATIFHPTVDFKFKNDTNHSILIQATVSGLHLTVDLYGTTDGRVAELTKPVITSQTPPPPEIRQDDPTLPKGEVKQVDHAAWGANVSFKRKVTRSGQVIIDESFKSNYRAWPNVFLVGTKEG